MKTKNSRQREEQDDIVDLIEYRLKKYVETFHQGTQDWDIASRILFMYLCGDVTVMWSSEGIIVEQLNLPEDNELKRLLLPLAGPQMNSTPFGEE